jgi:hypothetical protein
MLSDYQTRCSPGTKVIDGIVRWSKPFSTSFAPCFALSEASLCSNTCNLVKSYAGLLDLAPRWVGRDVCLSNAGPVHHPTQAGSFRRGLS